MASQWAETKYELPGQVEKILAATGMYFAQAGQVHLQRLVVNARPAVEEAISCDNWDGGQAGHRVRLQLPAELYYSILPNRQAIEEQLTYAMRQMRRFDHEYIDEVVVELQDAIIPTDWRERSGLVVIASPEHGRISDDDIGRLWGPGFFRVFLSHKAEFKAETAALKKSLQYYGITSFVAHEDIEPTREWQIEIEKALFSMEALVALLTDRFHQSNWTDQEIGVAIGRGVPVFPVRLGMDPYGFIGKYQGLQATGKATRVMANDIVYLLLSKTELQPRLAECLVTRLEQSTSYDQSNVVMACLLQLQSVPVTLIQRIESAACRNIQVGGAFDVSKGIPVLRQRSK